MIQQSKYCGVQISLFCHCILICISSQIRKFFMITQLASNASDASQLIIIGNPWTTTTWCMMHLSPPGWYANNEGQILYSLCLDALYSNWCWKHSLALLFSTTPLPANTLLNWHFIFKYPKCDRLNNNPLKDIHILIPGICDYYLICQKGCLH